MGDLIRRYWVPACLSEELPAPDCDPVRVRLLGEDLVAFRDSSGRVGLVEENCPHRGASLFFGRNEDGGLRCLYHGWKLDVAGRVLDTPCEPIGSTFKDRLRAVAYPVREQGDVVWTYMGPPALEPSFPSFEWTTLPSQNRSLAKVHLACNHLQGIEGVVDSSHVDLLHSGRAVMLGLPYAPPTYEVEDTPFGFRYAAIRTAPFQVVGMNLRIEDPILKYVRTSNFVMPFYTLVPPSTHAHMQIFVPMDDSQSWCYSVYFSTEEALDHEGLRLRRNSAVGPDLFADYTKKRTLQNSYWQDRAAMREKRSWSGIDANPNQDAAMQESMGAVYNRSREHLGYSDAAVIRLRERLLQAVRAFQAGQFPLGLDAPIPYESIRSQAKVVPIDIPWQQVSHHPGAPLPTPT